MKYAFSALLAAVLAASAEIATAQPQLNANAQAAVAEALYAYSASSAASERSLDAQINERRRQIDALRGQVRASNANSGTLVAQLAAEQQSFLTLLAERDRDYARELAVYRGAIEEIAAEPAGLAALERFNRNDELGALTSLDRIREARSRARQARDDLQSAAEARRIAVLAREAQERGRVDLASVIARYEEITRLDPRESYDWLDLGRLYMAAARYPDVERVAQRAEALGLTEWRRGRLRELRFDAAFFSGDLATAERYAEENLAEARRIVAEGAARQGETDTGENDVGGYSGPPLSAEEAGLFNLTTDLDRAGSIARHRGNFPRAVTYYNESLEIRRRLSERNPAPYFVEAQAGVLVNIANVESERGGDNAAALRAFSGAVSVLRPLVSRTQSVRVQLHLSTALSGEAEVLTASGQMQRAARSAAEALEISDRLYEGDRTNVEYGRALASALLCTGQQAYAAGDYNAAVRQFERARDVMREVAVAEGATGVSAQNVAHIATRLTASVFATGDHTRAWELASEAMGLWQRLAEALPDNALIRDGLAFSQDQLAYALGAIQQHSQAITYFEHALETRGAARAADTDPMWQAALWSMHGRATASEYVSNDLAQARYREGLERAQRVVAAQPGAREPRRAAAWFAYELWRWGAIPAADASAIWDALARDGLLMPIDQPRYDHIRAQAR